VETGRVQAVGVYKCVIAVAVVDARTVDAWGVVEDFKVFKLLRCDQYTRVSDDKVTVGGHTARRNNDDVYAVNGA
jgi:hypothetical protein